MNKPPDACFYLGNKAWFMPPPVEAPEVPEALSTPFWCARTHEAFGPDGEIACEETCNRARECYKPEIEI